MPRNMSGLTGRPDQHVCHVPKTRNRTFMPTPCRKPTLSRNAHARAAREKHEKTPSCQAPTYVRSAPRSERHCQRVEVWQRNEPAAHGVTNTYSTFIQYHAHGVHMRLVIHVNGPVRTQSGAWWRVRHLKPLRRYLEIHAQQLVVARRQRELQRRAHRIARQGVYLHQHAHGRRYHAELAASHGTNARQRRGIWCVCAQACHCASTGVWEPSSEETIWFSYMVWCFWRWCVGVYVFNKRTAPRSHGRAIAQSVHMATNSMRERAHKERVRGRKRVLRAQTT